jgi:uncharacterized protein YecT (DUF1311 family)
MTTRHFLRFAGLFVFVVLSLPRPALAAQERHGFDCRKAKTAVETLICHDRDLRVTDDLMADYYQTILKKLQPESGQVLVRDQKAWLAQRDKACADAGNVHDKTYCLLDFYRIRNRMLFSKFWEGPRLSPDAVAANLKKKDPLLNRGPCPISRDFDLGYYEHMAADGHNFSNILFAEIPHGLKVEVIQKEYRLIKPLPNRQLPSLNAPILDYLISSFYYINDKIKIDCRVQDANGSWWLVRKDEGGLMSYFPESDNIAVP